MVEAKQGRPSWPQLFAALLAKELRQHAMGFRFRALAVLALALMTLSGLLGAGRLRVEQAEGLATLERHRERLAEVTVARAAVLSYPALKPPWRLAFAVGGGQARSADLYLQSPSPLVAPELRGNLEANPRLQGAAVLDWLLVLLVVMSLGAFVLAHESIVGEGQRGTFKALLAGVPARGLVLLAKISAVWLLLTLPLLLGAGIALGLMAALGGFVPNSAELLRLALVLTVGLWALGFWVLVAMFVSLRTRHAGVGLTLLALLWLMGVEAVPAASLRLAQALAPVPSERQLQRKLDEVRDAVEEEHGTLGSWRSRERGKVDDYAWERASAHIVGQLFAEQEAWRRDRLRRQLRQVELAERLAAVSPMALFRQVGERLAGTGVQRDREFLEQSWTFREQLGERLGVLDRRDPASPHVLFFDRYMSQQRLAPASLPVFSFRERSVAEGVQAAAGRLMVLFGLSLLLAALVYAAFMAYDANPR